MANSYVDQQQELKERRCDSMGKEKAKKAQSWEGKNRISVITGIELF